MSHATPELGDLLERAHRYALSLTHDPHRAEDLIQDACLAVSRRGGPWRIEYLISVIRNRHIDLHRRNGRVRFKPLRPSASVGGNGHAKGAIDEELAAALGTLGPNAREMLYLAVVEGYSATQIARATGRPRGTVLSSIHRSKHKLRTALETTHASEHR